MKITKEAFAVVAGQDDVTDTEGRASSERMSLVDVKAGSFRPFGAFLTEPIHVPTLSEAATWPSACTIKGIFVPDDY